MFPYLCNLFPLPSPTPEYETFPPILFAYFSIHFKGANPEHSANYLPKSLSALIYICYANSFYSELS